MYLFSTTKQVSTNTSPLATYNQRSTGAFSPSRNHNAQTANPKTEQISFTKRIELSTSKQRCSVALEAEKIQNRTMKTQEKATVELKIPKFWENEVSGNTAH